MVPIVAGAPMVGMAPTVAAAPMVRRAPMVGAVRYRMRIYGTGLVLAAIGLLAAGCGGSSGAAATPEQTGFAAYSACMAKNGVTLPQNNGGGNGRPEGRRASARRSGSGG